MNGGRRTFVTMNGLRGVAAIIVVAFHWFGGLPNGYLAVDFFYVLSGFVIAHAYENRLGNGLSVRAFFAIRLARLYPLYLLGTVLSVLVLAASFAVKGAVIPAEQASFHSLPFALLMLPTPPALAPTDAGLYPLDAPAWSLFFEVAINLAYAASFRFWSLARLATLIGMCGAMMLWHLFAHGTLYGDGGINWPSFVLGFLRVGFSFPIGVLIYRLYVIGRLPAVRLPSAALAVAMVAVLAVPLTIMPLMDVFVFFPLIVALSANSEPRTASAKSTFQSLGVASYAIYVLHEPFHGAILAALAKFGVADGATVDAILIASIIPICLTLNRFYDVPVRARLSSFAVARQPKTV